ncbi:MAG: amidophosphoribosyltransferase [Vicinamibacterales bacterium]
MPDKFEDECGVFGVYNHPGAVSLTTIGLLSLQHRGHESAGVACSRDGVLHCVRAKGWVSHLADRHLGGVSGSAAIGHVRYSTCGDSSLANAQPLVVATRDGHLALCHNGNIVNAHDIRTTLRDSGATFDGDGDTEVVARLLARRWSELPEHEAFRKTFEMVRGAYSIVVLTSDRMYALRDPLGIRPLSLGRIGDAIVISSETCGFDAIGATHVRDIRPGELLVVGRAGVRSFQFQTPAPLSAQCVFELIYFARPDSVTFGHSVAAVRMALGRRLAQEQPADADVVVPIPDSGLYCGIGYARGTGIGCELALVRNAHVGRTFIRPDVAERRATIAAKYNVIRDLVAGRRVALVDDSLVRGSTCESIVARVREAGAREVHVRIASPETIGPCYFGVDTPDEGDLFATGRSVAEMARLLGADSLAFLSLDGLLRAVAGATGGYCSGCYTRRYPIDPDASPRTARSVAAPARLYTACTR